MNNFVFRALLIRFLRKLLFSRGPSLSSIPRGQALIPDRPETKLNAIDRRKAITTAFIDKVCNNDADCGKECGTYTFV